MPYTRRQQEQKIFENTLGVLHDHLKITSTHTVSVLSGVQIRQDDT